MTPPDDWIVSNGNFYYAPAADRGYLVRVRGFRVSGVYPLFTSKAAWTWLVLETAGDVGIARSDDGCLETEGAAKAAALACYRRMAP